MLFHVDCRCGRRLEVTTANAGNDVTCPCGNVNAVPSLSELRHRAGLPSYDVTIAGTIRQKVADGQLPSGGLCVRCGMPTEETLDCAIECERMSARGSSYWETILVGMFLPWVWGRVIDKYFNADATGRELVVEAPLRVRADCRRRLSKPTRRKELRALLETVPEYAELLNEYPNAEIGVS